MCQLSPLVLVLTVFIITVQSFVEPEVPTTFGLLTITHQRGADNSQFMIYLQRYAKMDCPVISEINIVWNNEKSMEELGVLKKQDEWTKPINFYKSPYNSMVWRFKIPKESKASVYFSIDDDIDVSCQELTKGFQQWRSLAIGSIAPIVSYGPRLHQYTLRQGQKYSTGQSPFYSIGLVGLAFISRHFAQLYYADVLQFNQMRRIIQQKNNCDDIGLNWIVQYYYPQLQTKSIFGQIQNVSPTIGQSTNPIHFIYRRQCMNLFTQIFGINSMRYMPINQTIEGYEQRIIPLRRQIVLLKQKYIDEVILLKKYENSTQKFNASQLLQQLIELYSDIPDVSYVQNKHIFVDFQLKKGETAAGKLLQMEQDLKKVQNENHQIQAQSLNIKKLIESAKIKLIKTDQFLNDRENLKQMKLKIYIHSYFELFLLVLAIFLLWRIVENKKRNSSQNHHNASEFIQQQEDDD